ncbi:GNAT family N-acetyltransferase [Aminipila terrae]|uniref:GNAT family N-acetyltransferase n=1 Tax=Aminipila terrae TaxID=2697030 RepID=A0A6P1MB78_9FIRM|nr:GNAT family N-acetyltransferase [Aminipila terrae]QHI71292.1 GNAT family N-acetyltransferase [Aminipila terrae]
MNLYNRIKNKYIIKEYQLVYYINSINRAMINGNFQFAKADIHDVELIRDLYYTEFSHNKYNIYIKRLEDPNNIIIVCKYKGEICGYFNMSFKNTLESGINEYIKVSDKETYFYDDYVFEKFRGNGIHMQSILYRIEIAKEKGRNKILVNIYSNNRVSLKEYQSVGFNIIKFYKRNKITNKLITFDIDREKNDK